MSITKVLSEKDVNSEDKLKSVAETVAAARKAYGNEDAVIECPVVNTAHGSMPFSVLEDDSKVAVLRDEVAYIKAAAVEFDAQNEGVNVNKKIEELIAVNPLLANIAPGTKFNYI